MWKSSIQNTAAARSRTWYYSSNCIGLFSRAGPAKLFAGALFSTAKIGKKKLVERVLLLLLCCKMTEAMAYPRPDMENPLIFTGSSRTYSHQYLLGFAENRSKWPIERPTESLPLFPTGRDDSYYYCCTISGCTTTAAVNKLRRLYMSSTGMGFRSYKGM